MPIKKEEKIGIRKSWCEETNFETCFLNPKLCFWGAGQREGWAQVAGVVALL